MGWLVIFLTLPILLNAVGDILARRSPDRSSNSRLLANLGWCQVACCAVVLIVGLIHFLRPRP